MSPDDPTAYLADRPVLSRRQARLLLVLVPLLVAVAAAWATSGPWIGRLEGMSLDWRFRLRGPRPPPRNIVVVELDRASREALRRGDQAFDLRAHLPAAINHLADAGALVIGTDFWLEGLTRPEIDGPLAEAIANANVVLAVAATDGGMVRAGKIFRASDPVEGSITVYPDTDGTLRRFPDHLYVSLLGENGRPQHIDHFPLALAWYAIVQQQPDARIHAADGRTEIGNRVVRARELIDFSSVRPEEEDPRCGWRTLSFRQVVDPGFPATREYNELTGCIVLIGETRSLQDAHAMPLTDRLSPGVYYHANAVAHVLENRAFDDRWASPAASAGLTGGLGLAAGLFAWADRRGRGRRRGAWRLLARPAIGAAVFVGGWSWAAAAAFDRGVLLPHVAPALAASAGLITGLAGQWALTSIRLRREAERNRRIEGLFGRSVSSSVLEALKQNPLMLSRTEVREVSVLFCDLRGFTARTRDMPPERVAAMLNEYFNHVAAAVFEHEGFLDKFVGDEIMAVFAVPFDQPDHAARAVRTAIDVKRRLAGLNAVLQERGEAPLNCGMGIHCGPAAAGHIGSHERSNYTVVGTTVNLASRIEKFTQRGEILISEAVRARLPEIDGLTEGAAVRRWDEVEIRGSTARHVLYEVVT